MVANQGKITTLAVDASVNKGLVDGTDKMHSGILKVLESFAQGNICISHAGFTITDGGTYTQYNLAQPIKFFSNGQFTNHTVTLTEAYTSTVQDATHSRYDWVLINPATPELIIVRGTAGATPLVSDITAGYIPIALVHITAGTDDDKFDYAFQTFTMNVTKNSLSVGYNDSGYTETASITGASAGTTITSSGILTLDSDDVKITASANGKPTLTLETTGSNLANEPAIIFSRTATANAAGLDIGRITFNGTDDGGNTHNFAQIVGDGEDETGGTEDGLMILQVAKGGSDEVEHFRISGSFGNVFNSGQADIDTRIKGDTDAALFYANAGTDRVGIGVDSPTTKLEVKGDTTISRSADDSQTRTLTIEGARNATGNAFARIDLKNYDSHGPTSYVGARIAAINEATGVNDGTLTFSTNNANAGITEAMRITDSRNVGIGTTSPSVKLDVAGAITSSGTITGVTVSATDVNTANITSTANQNLSYEVITGATPISGLKTVVYSSAINGNTAALPAPASGNILTVVNLDAANPITLTGTPLINNGAVGHPKITAPNTITLASFEHVTLQAVNDTLGILQTGHIIISN